MERKTMNMKFILGTIVFSILMTGLFAGDTLKTGTNAPYFKVKSGDDKELNSSMIKGKVVVIFYETKDLIEKNRKLKNELNEFYDNQPDAIKNLIIKLPIIDCSGAFRLFVRMWKNSLIDHSKKERMVIYGDWDAKMFSNFKMKKDESNIIILDKKGIIQYYKHGTIEDNEVIKIKELLLKYVNEK